MASAVILNQSDTAVISQYKSDLITADLDTMPSSSITPPTDPTQSAIDPTLHKMSAYIQLEDENKQLKAQLAEIHAQRQAEQYAHISFVKMAESLDAQLAPQARTPAFGLAMKNLVDIGHTYRNLTKYANQKYGVEDGTSSISSMMPAVTCRSQPTTSLQQQPTHAWYRPHSASSRHQMSTMIQNTLAELGFRPPESSQSFAVALADLKNNADSFTPFIVEYLNGRHEYLTKGLRSQVDKVIGFFFDDPDDRRRIVSKVVDVLKAGVKYADTDVQVLAGDIIKPLGALLWALVEFLNNEP